jgi:hypothetical protein
VFCHFRAPGNRRQKGINMFVETKRTWAMIAASVLTSGLGGGVAIAGSSSSTTAVTVLGTAAIFLAGRTDVTIPAPGAPLPPGYPLVRTTGPSAETFPVQLAASSGESFQFSNASGSVNTNYTNSYAIAGPDGTTVQGETLNSVGGISGYNGDIAPLVGVFLTDSDPENLTAPSTLNFSTPASRSFLTLSPALDQVFYIGDGLTGTGTGTTQTFDAPAGATRLFLGVPDGADFEDTPGTYDDNTGSFSVTVTGTTVPEPSSAGLVALAMSAALGRRRRRNRTVLDSTAVSR